MTKLATTRRAVFGAMAVAPVAMAVPAIAATNPDAELLAMYERWKKAVDAYNSWPTNDKEADDHPVNVEWTQCYRALDKWPAPKSPQGLAVLLRYYLSDCVKTTIEESALARDGTRGEVEAFVQANENKFEYAEDRLPWVLLIGALTIAEGRA